MSWSLAVEGVGTILEDGGERECSSAVKALEVDGRRAIFF